VALGIAALTLSLIALGRQDCYPVYKDDEVARYVLNARHRVVHRGQTVRSFLDDIEAGHGTWGDLDLWVIDIHERQMLPKSWAEDAGHGRPGKKPAQVTRMAVASILRQAKGFHKPPNVTSGFVAYQDQSWPLDLPFTRRAYVAFHTDAPGDEKPYLIGAGYYVRSHCYYANSYNHESLGRDL
jgi:hypothetical protein